MTCWSIFGIESTNIPRNSKSIGGTCIFGEGKTVNMLNFFYIGKLHLRIDRRKFKIIFVPTKKQKKIRGIMSLPLRLAEKTEHESSCGIPQVSASIDFCEII